MTFPWSALRELVSIAQLVCDNLIYSIRGKSAMELKLL